MQEDTPRTDLTHDQPDVLTLAVETARIGVRTVDRGGLRLQTVTETVAEQLETTLRSSEVEVTRVPIGRVVETAPEVREEDGVTIIPVLEERAVVTTELVLVEEIRLTRRETSETVSVPVTLRRQRLVETPLPPRNDTDNTGEE